MYILFVNFLIESNFLNVGVKKVIDVNYVSFLEKIELSEFIVE